MCLVCKHGLCTQCDWAWDVCEDELCKEKLYLQARAVYVHSICVLGVCEHVLCVYDGLYVYMGCVYMVLQP